MRVPPVARLLADGRRLHLQHGPIDLVVEAVGLTGRGGNQPRHAEERGAAARLEARTTVARASRRRFAAPQHDEAGWAEPSRTDADVVRTAYLATIHRFDTILDELCGELPLLRSRADRHRIPQGAVARRMHAAVLPFASETFITPMAAVAGAVAEEVLRAMTAAAPLRRAWVNNGGDIALHLAPGESLRLGLVDRPDRPGLFGTAVIRAEDGIGGVATSGWRGRSFSMGIADAVTILARTAAAADAAATVVANAVDLPGHPGVTRMPADAVQADSDLGGRPVTRDVSALTPGEIEGALARGAAVADHLIARGLIGGAALHVQGSTRTAGRGAPSPLAGEGGLRDSGGRMRGAQRRDPSSVIASRCHLLPQGEKEFCHTAAFNDASQARP